MELSSGYRETLIQLRYDLKGEAGTVAATLDTLIWQLQQREEERLKRLSAGGSR